MRLGLNPLLVDADVIVYHDPYPHLKSVLANHTLVALSDESAGYARVNGGVWYAQAAHRDGPSVGIFADFERRVISMLAAAEHPPETIIRVSQGANRGRPASILLYDQALINDVLFSTLVGRDVSYKSGTKFDAYPNAIG